MSLVEYYGLRDGRCGYCKSTSNRRISHDLDAISLRAIDYQEMLDRGWRRSGTYCYKPVNKYCCCPNYPIFCQANLFKLSRYQRKCIQNMNDFLMNDTRTRNSIRINYYPDQQQDLSKHTNWDATLSKKRAFNLENFDKLEKSSKLRDRRFAKSCQLLVGKLDLSLEQAITRVIERNLRRHLTKNKLLSTLEDFLYPKRNLNRDHPEPAHKLELKLRHVQSSDCVKERSEQVKLMQSYQTEVHNETCLDWTDEKFSSFLVDTPLSIEPLINFKHTDSNTENPSEFIETKEDNFSCKRTSQDEFLLVEPSDLPTCYGTYHCSYLLDGKLLALGVIDVLPKGLTTVYFLYDTAFKKLQLGVYSALVEVSLTRAISHLQVENPPPQILFENYHLGYYVHECKKMRYKTRFHPAFLLCSETNDHVPLKRCLQKLNGLKYVKFSESNHNFVVQAEIDAAASGSDLVDVQTRIDPMMGENLNESLINCTSFCKYLDWLKQNRQISDEVIELLRNFMSRYVRQVGFHLSRRMEHRLNSIHRSFLQ